MLYSIEIGMIISEQRAVELVKEVSKSKTKSEAYNRPRRTVMLIASTMSARATCTLCCVLVRVNVHDAISTCVNIATFRMFRSEACSRQ